MNIEGQLIQSNNIEVFEGDNLFKLKNLSELSAGTYLLSIQQGSQVSIIKIIKQQR